MIPLANRQACIKYAGKVIVHESIIQSPLIIDRYCFVFQKTKNGKLTFFTLDVVLLASITRVSSTKFEGSMRRQSFILRFRVF